MKKYIIGSLVAFTLFIGVAQAQVVDNTELINRLLKQLAELTAIVQQLQAQQAAGRASGGGGGSSTNNGAFSVSARFVENREDKVGIWDVFKPGKGNASSITTDWAWDVTFYNNTDKLRHIKKISILHESTGEGWSTDYEKMYNRANGYPLLVTSNGKTLETKYVSDIDIEVDAKSRKTFRLYGQPEGSTYKEATVWVYFADGSATSLRATRENIIYPITVTAESSQVIRIETARRVYDRNVTVLPGGEETLFAVGLDTNAPVYANTLEVRFKKVSGSGNFEDYLEKISLVDRFNRPISYEGGVFYDGDTTIYKFTKLAHRITRNEDFYLKIKAKSDMDKAGKFSMMVPKDGLTVDDNRRIAGVVTNTVTFDPSYTLKKKETSVEKSYLTIISPNGGQTYNVGDKVSIRFRTNLDITNSDGITLQLVKSSAMFNPLITIAKGLRGPDGSYEWTIPTIDSGEYKIYAVGSGVYAQGSSIADFSDKPFTILPVGAAGGANAYSGLQDLLRQIQQAASTLQ